MDIEDNMKVILGLMLAVVLNIHSATANSYMDMITTAPEGYQEQAETVHSVGHIPLWYDYRIQTSAPVVTSSLPKYQAWLQSQRLENRMSYHRDDMQDMIYFLSGAAVARFAYDIWGPHHRHHLLRR